MGKKSGNVAKGERRQDCDLRKRLDHERYVGEKDKVKEKKYIDVAFGSRIKIFEEFIINFEGYSFSFTYI